MPDLSVNSTLLSVRPLTYKEMPAPRGMRSPPNLNYTKYDNKYARYYGERHNAAGAVGSILKMGMQALNEGMIGIKLKQWLTKNEKSIIAQMSTATSPFLLNGKLENRKCNAFVASVVYTASTGNDSVYYMYKDTTLVGFIPTPADVGIFVNDASVNGAKFTEKLNNPNAVTMSVWLLGQKRV